MHQFYLYLIFLYTSHYSNSKSDNKIFIESCKTDISCFVNGNIFPRLINITDASNPKGPSSHPGFWQKTQIAYIRYVKLKQGNIKGIVNTNRLCSIYVKLRQGNIKEIVKDTFNM